MYLEQVVAAQKKYEQKHSLYCIIRFSGFIQQKIRYEKEKNLIEI